MGAPPSGRLDVEVQVLQRYSRTSCAIPCHFRRKWHCRRYRSCVCVCACACSPLTSEVPKKVFLGTFNGVYEMNNIVEALASAFEPEDMKHGHREH